MSDGWSAYGLAPDGDIENCCNPEEAGALKAYLGQRTTTTEAAQAIISPIMATDYPREDRVCLWTLLVDALLEESKARNEHMELF